VPRVSIVIPTRNAGDAFTETLDAIAAQDLGEPFELVVVDSGSTDGTSARAEARGARVIAIDPAEFGHGHTRNLGIACAFGVGLACGAGSGHAPWIKPIDRRLVRRISCERNILHDTRQPHFGPH